MPHCIKPDYTLASGNSSPFFGREEQAARHSRVAAGVRNKILLVEDDRCVREALAEILAFEGYEIIQAVDGAEALRLLQDGLVPNLILLDMIMPGTDGWQFRQQQLERPDWSDIPVVVISGVYGIEYEANTLKVACCLFKPIQIGQLLKVVRQFCD